MTAPDIPQSIKALRVDRYHNIFELVPNCPRLFGTETLCCDWDGEILIVAQDFSTTPEMVRRLCAGEQDPYHHDPKIPTNRKLVCLLQENGVQIDISGNGALTCGVLYMSACFFLKDMDGLGAGLPNRRAMKQCSRPVFDFTISQMPNLRHIITLGSFAFQCVRAWLDMERITWRAAVEARAPLAAGRYSVFVSSHTSSRGINNRRRKGDTTARGIDLVLDDWRAIFATIRAHR